MEKGRGKRSANIFAVVKKKHIAVVAVIILFAAACMGGFFLCRARANVSREKFVVEEWNLALPEGRNLKYTAVAAHMDGHDYFLAYTFKETPAAFLKKCTALQSQAAKEGMQDIFVSIKTGGWLAPQTKIPKKYGPDWETAYLWMSSPDANQREGCYIAYFSQKRLLLVFERHYR